jgi:hypothetical protein
MLDGQFTEEHYCVDLAQLVGVFAHEITQALFGVNQFETLRMPHSADFWMLVGKLLSRQIP